MPKRNLNYNYPMLTPADFSKGLKRANDYNVTPPVNQTLIIPRVIQINTNYSCFSLFGHFLRYFSLKTRSESVRQILESISITVVIVTLITIVVFFVLLFWTIFFIF